MPSKTPLDADFIAFLVSRRHSSLLGAEIREPEVFIAALSAAAESGDNEIEQLIAAHGTPASVRKLRRQYTTARHHVSSGTVNIRISSETAQRLNALHQQWRTDSHDELVRLLLADVAASEMAGAGSVLLSVARKLPPAHLEALITELACLWRDGESSGRKRLPAAAVQELERQQPVLLSLQGLQDEDSICHG